MSNARAIVLDLISVFTCLPFVHCQTLCALDFFVCHSLFNAEVISVKACDDRSNRR